MENGSGMTRFEAGPETDRLYHRAFRIGDADAFFALNGSEEVMRYTGEPLVASVEAARRAIRDYPDFDEYGYGRWACVLKESGAVIGFCGLKFLPELSAVDLGYRFLPEYWGQGLATESCRASLRFGFETLGLGEVIALVLPENHASIRVLQKLGMSPDGEYTEEGLIALRFVIRSSDPRPSSVAVTNR